MQKHVAFTTYAVEVRIYNDGGSLSPENFAVVSGYYVTGASVAAETATTVRDGLIASLSYNLAKRGNGEVVVSASGADIVIAGLEQTVVPGKIVGKQIEFDVVAKQFLNTSITHENLGLLTATVTSENYPGTGTGKYAVNLEWFNKGYKYEVYRQTGFPVDFASPSYASISGIYNTIHIKYFDDRISPNVERQYKLLTVLIDKGTDTLANNANTNLVLADLRTILGSDNIPADLAVI